jgi:hypothetical protein
VRFIGASLTSNGGGGGGDGGGRGTELNLIELGKANLTHQTYGRSDRARAINKRMKKKKVCFSLHVGRSFSSSFDDYKLIKKFLSFFIALIEHMCEGVGMCVRGRDELLAVGHPSRRMSAR